MWNHVIQSADNMFNANQVSSAMEDQWHEETHFSISVWTALIHYSKSTPVNDASIFFMVSWCSKLTKYMSYY